MPKATIAEATLAVVTVQRVDFRCVLNRYLIRPGACSELFVRNAVTVSDQTITKELVVSA